MITWYVLETVKGILIWRLKVKSDKKTESVIEKMAEFWTYCIRVEWMWVPAVSPLLINHMWLLSMENILGFVYFWQEIKNLACLPYVKSTLYCLAKDCHETLNMFSCILNLFDLIVGTVAYCILSFTCCLASYPWVSLSCTCAFVITLDGFMTYLWETWRELKLQTAVRDKILSSEKRASELHHAWAAVEQQKQEVRSEAMKER